MGSLLTVGMGYSIARSVMQSDIEKIILTQLETRYIAGKRTDCVVLNADAYKSFISKFSPSIVAPATYSTDFGNIRFKVRKWQEQPYAYEEGTIEDPCWMDRL